VCCVHDCCVIIKNPAEARCRPARYAGASGIKAYCPRCNAVALNGERAVSYGAGNGGSMIAFCLN